MDDKALRSLAGFLVRLSALGFHPGGWSTPPNTRDGSFQMPYVSMSDPVRAFVEAAYDDGWLDTEFDWSEWFRSERAQRLCEDPDALAAAGREDLSRLLTVCIRRDRFCEGALLEDFECGLILRIVQRANAILAEEEAT